MFFQKKTKSQIIKEKAGNVAAEAFDSLLTSLVEETSKGNEVDLTTVTLQTVKGGFNGSKKKVKKRTGFFG
ncbi:MAG: hypothetical protein ACRC6H_05470 [Culicoidibacterales bacterium]